MDNDFQKRLLATFKVETKEHLTAVSAGLIELEKAGDAEQRQAILEVVFREVHSLKGAARAVNMTGVESVSHALESVFAAMRRKPELPSPALFDLLHQAVDTIERLLLSLETDRGTIAPAHIRELVQCLQNAVAGTAPLPPTPASLLAEYQENPVPEKQSQADTVRIASGKLDSLLHQAEELVAAKLSALQRTIELDDIDATFVLWEKEWRKTRPARRKMDKIRQTATSRSLAAADVSHLTRLLEFLDWNHAFVKSMQSKVHSLTKTSASDRHTLNGMVDTLLDDMKEALMLPFAIILEPLPKMVRDLARDRGKDAELVQEGSAIEIDKRILEELKDPLLHLLRNCVDHGIEKPDERQRKGKPARGEISVAATLLDSNRIEIRVADDGAGIDTARLLETAVKSGLTGADEAELLERGKLLEFIFTSGFSTSPVIDDISGRGLGLAIVREKVTNLGGAITVASEPQGGTTFTIVLPLSLSTYRGILVRAGEQLFVIPAPQVERCARTGNNAIKTVENRETVLLGNEAVSFVRLASVLGLPRSVRKGEEPDDVRLFVLNNGEVRIAFGVEEILGEQEILVKGLGRQLSRVRNISGSTVLGTGKVVAILHPGDLLKSAVKVAAAPAATIPGKEAAVRKSVLIVEDSITARTLLKNIIETAGYETSTAVDGLDALALLRTEEIDLVVSDVDMPRMNGFDLTARIRASREFAELPVILVTSLDSREDRERGIEAGANAYLVKSSFDQSNLIEIIRRFI
jgi:two-component system chemotaxis sensor kinase CheA